MTVNNGVTIDMNDVIEHLKFAVEESYTGEIRKDGDIWKLCVNYGSNYFMNPVTVDNNVITFGTFSGEGPAFYSYTWG